MAAPAAAPFLTRDEEVESVHRHSSAPLAIVVLGGLVSSTVLNLFVVPAGYALAFRIRQST
jgi:Cu/Ag efflux pump CusA